jgi:hypothetical protein
MVHTTVNSLTPVGPGSPKAGKLITKGVLNHTLLDDCNLDATLFPRQNGTFASPRMTMQAKPSKATKAFSPVGHSE